MTTRLNKFLVQQGAAPSRRKADDLIATKKVLVNKKIAKPGQAVDGTEQITVDGKRVKVQNQKTIVVAMHKPEGYVCTKQDKYAADTIYKLLPGHLTHKVHSIGRLDKETEGLLLLTNNGEITQALTHPSQQTEKEYKVVVKGKLYPDQKEQLENGVKIDGYRTRPAAIHSVDYVENRKKTTLYIIIQEGKKRQLRRMFDAVKKPIMYLQRVRMGNIELGKLKKGRWVELTPEEIEQIK